MCNEEERDGIHSRMEQPSEEGRPRIRMTTQLLREILDSLRDDIETLGMEEAMTEGEEVPDAVECATIERVEGCCNPAQTRCFVKCKPWRVGN